MAITFTQIAYTSLASTATSFSFTNIPTTYTDLKIIGNFRMNFLDIPRMRFNADTGNNFSEQYIAGQNAIASVGSNRNEISSLYGYATTTGSACFIDINNYLSNRHKSWIAKHSSNANNSSETYNWYVSGIWAQTAAITSITFIASSSRHFAIGTSVGLYGIKEA